MFSGSLVRKLELLTLILLLSLPVQAGVEKELRRSFDVVPGGTLELDTERGSIEVRTHDDSRIDVLVKLESRTGDREDAAKLFERFDVDFEPSGSDLSIEGRLEGGRALFGWLDSSKLRVKWEVVVPTRYDLDLRTAGGSIGVHDLDGNVVAKTSGGSLVFGRVLGTVRARTSGGSIAIEETGGNVEVSTSGGSITIDSARGDVHARTSGGSIKVNEVFGAIDAVTSGGSIKAAISKQPGSDCRLSTSGGSVTVYLDPSIAVDLDARSSGGRVRADVPITVQGEMGRTRLEGRINGGGPALVLRTSGGGISIRSN
ncbi:MAG: DUF4097 family beta strand repeat-containing protein [Thermoanaerobaculia bacterium]|nr:DUF4097 family beta strand repeat-containing protein [Thermoanaerobaculia bacterium]